MSAAKNKIECCGDHYLAKMSNGYAFKFDKEDLPIINSRVWYPSIQGYQIYPICKSGRKLHKYIFPDVERGYEVDHINRDSLDNRRCNLRICTHQQNQFNQDLQSNNSSGYSGVSYYPPRSKYRARIKFWKNDIHLGYFQTLEDAARSRKFAEEILFGEYAVLPEIDDASYREQKRIREIIQIKLKVSTSPK